MSTERWLRLEQVFVDAVELPPSARHEAVSRACAGDDALQREAMLLLAAHDESGQFLARPALDVLAHSVSVGGWTLQPGQRIGAYSILRLLGAGGSGEVWRARDDRLGRDVAIKVLLPHHSSDAEHVRRFAEEARTAGALNHPNVLTVHDAGEHRGVPFLVSECLEGRSLRQRMDAGRIPVPETMGIALGIARGLAAAHARGIIHRDLKPENTFIADDGGAVKILDFGLATLESSLGRFQDQEEQAKTGVIVGTAGYMAPEQVRGEEVDARTDLFALGVMLYEMLEGRHPFRRPSIFETLNAVLTDDPPPPLTTQGEEPSALSQVVMRLLQRSPGARFQSAIDLAWALEQVAAARPATGARPSSRSGMTPRWRFRGLEAIAASIATAAVLMGSWWMLSKPPPLVRGPALTRFTWTLPAGLVLDSAPMVSPDSRQIALAGKDAAGRRLYVRAFDSTEFRAVPGSEGAAQPFWSPDSRSLGFFAGQRLMTVALPGGAPVAIADALSPHGGAWGRTGVILQAPDIVLAGIDRVGFDGRNREPATLLTNALGDTAHWWPAFLPDGIHFLYSVSSTEGGRRGVYIGQIDRPAPPAGPPLLQSSSPVVYVPLQGYRRRVGVPFGRTNRGTTLRCSPDGSHPGREDDRPFGCHEHVLSPDAAERVDRRTRVTRTHSCRGEPGWKWSSEMAIKFAGGLNRRRRTGPACHPTAGSSRDNASMAPATTPTSGWRIWNAAPGSGSPPPPFPIFRPSGLPMASVWRMSPETYPAGLARES